MGKRKRQNCSQDDASVVQCRRSAKRSRHHHQHVEPTGIEKTSVSQLAKQYGIAIAEVPIEIEKRSTHKTRRRRSRRTAIFELELPLDVQASDQQESLDKTTLKISKRRPDSTVLRNGPTVIDPDLSSLLGKKLRKHRKIGRVVDANHETFSESDIKSTAALPCQHPDFPDKNQKSASLAPSRNFSACVETWSITHLPVPQQKQWRDKSQLPAANRQVKQEAHQTVFPEALLQDQSRRKIPNDSRVCESVSRSRAELCSLSSEQLEGTDTRAPDWHEGHLSLPKISTTEHTKANTTTAKVSQKALTVPSYFHIGSLEDARKRLGKSDEDSDDESTSSSDEGVKETATINACRVAGLPPGRQTDPIRKKNNTQIDPEKASRLDVQHLLPNQQPELQGFTEHQILPNMSQLGETAQLDKSPEPKYHERSWRLRSRTVNTNQRSSPGEKGSTRSRLTSSAYTSDTPATHRTFDDEVPATVPKKKQKATKSKSPHFCTQTRRKTRESTSQLEQAKEMEQCCGVIRKLDADLLVPDVGDIALIDISDSGTQYLADGAVSEGQIKVSADETQCPKGGGRRRLTRTKSKRTGMTSDYFIPDTVDRVDHPDHKATSQVQSHPITDHAFGIIQEKTWAEPFWLLIAVKFLNVTRGRAAIPIFWDLKAKYPTPEDLAVADQKELMKMTRPLGLQRVRSVMMIQMAEAWMERPPAKGTRFRTLHYPDKGNGKLLKKGSVLEDGETVSDGALELGGFPGCSRYAYDSWRIFCRDVCRGVAEDYNGAGARDDFQPEWKRVLPQDKELRAFLAWMWLREEWVWDYMTGEKVLATDEQMEQARLGTFRIDVESAAQSSGN